MHREERYQVHSHKYGIFHAFRNTTTTKARGSVWSIGHRRPLAIALCSGLILLLLSSLYLAAWALPQCLTSSCCEAGLSSSFPASSRSELGVWWWMLASWGCVRSSPTSSSEFVLLLVPVPLAPTALHLGSSLAIGCCRCAADRCWRLSGFSVALPLSSSKFRIRRARLTSHWSWRCEVWFLSWSPWTTRCSWAWQKLLWPCQSWLWHLCPCPPAGQLHSQGRWRNPLPWWALHRLWLVYWQWLAVH